MYNGFEFVEVAFVGKLLGEQAERPSGHIADYDAVGTFWSYVPLYGFSNFLHGNAVGEIFFIDGEVNEGFGAVVLDHFYLVLFKILSATFCASAQYWSSPFKVHSPAF